MKKQSGSIDFAGLSYNIDYIALETVENSLIPDIWGLKFDSQFIFVLSAQGGVFQFDRAGKFIRKISSQGRGPEEYNLLQDIAIDSENEKIYLLDMNGKILIFNYDGKFIKSHNLQGQYMFSKLHVIDQERIIVVPFNFMGGKSALLYEYDLTKMGADAIGNAPTFTVESYESTMYTITKGVFGFDNKIIVHPNFSSSVFIYDLDTKTLKNRYDFSFKTPFYPNYLGKGFNALKETQALTDISETKDHIFATIADNQQSPDLYIIDKQSGKSYKSDLRYSGNFKSLFRAKYQSDNTIADIIDFDYLNYQNGEKPTEQERESAIEFFSIKTGVKLTDESNPVVILIY